MLLTGVPCSVVPRPNCGALKLPETLDSDGLERQEQVPKNTGRVETRGYSSRLRAGGQLFHRRLVRRKNGSIL